jgi:hypothetical protein
MDPFVPQIYYWNGLYFLAFWFGMLWIIAQISGWKTLAEQYGLGDMNPDEATWKGWQYGRFNNAMWYKGCLWVGMSPAGLFLKTGPDLLFRFGHPPLFIPWSRIQVGEPYRFLWRKMQRIQVEGISFPIGLPEALVQQFTPWLSRQSA